MPRNVEIKARSADLAGVEARARALADRDPIDVEQCDTFFVAATGRLKLRDFGDGSGELIHYERADVAGPKTSRYARVGVDDPAKTTALLGAALGREIVVRKHRRIYLAGRTRIHLDRVEGLGDFVELEVVLNQGEAEAAGALEADRVMARLGIAAGDLVEGAYADLLAAEGAGVPTAGREAAWAERIDPGASRESVWDYPRPPALEPLAATARVEFAGAVIAESSRALRILETSHPPTIYFPPDDLRRDLLERAPGRSLCEWKGQAAYWTIAVGERRSEAAGWSYADPRPAYAALRDHVAFYPSRADACWIGEERVRAQAGDFYGGWITSAVAGPFKGEPGSELW